MGVQRLWSRALRRFQHQTRPTPGPSPSARQSRTCRAHRQGRAPSIEERARRPLTAEIDRRRKDHTRLSSGEDSQKSPTHPVFVRRRADTRTAEMVSASNPKYLRHINSTCRAKLIKMEEIQCSPRQPRTKNPVRRRRILVLANKKTEFDKSHCFGKKLKAFLKWAWTFRPRSSIPTAKTYKEIRISDLLNKKFHVNSIFYRNFIKTIGNIHRPPARRQQLAAMNIVADTVGF